MSEEDSATCARYARYADEKGTSFRHTGYFGKPIITKYRFQASVCCPFSSWWKKAGKDSSLTDYHNMVRLVFPAIKAIEAQEQMQSEKPDAHIYEHVVLTALSGRQGYESNDIFESLLDSRKILASELLLGGAT